MNRHLTNQPYLDKVFVPTGNAGRSFGIVTPVDKPDWWDAFACKLAVPLIAYKGPLASDKQQPHDIQVRVSGNMGSRKKEPVGVRASRWLNQNPAVYAEFKRLALQLIARGRKHYGAKSIAEHMRRCSEFTGGPDYKVANIAVRYMAIRFIEEHPQHAGFFSIHKRK